MAFGSKKRRRQELEQLLDDEMVGLVEPGIEFEGKLRFAAGMVRLNAHFRGEIRCEGALIVADQGEVDAEIHAANVSISGKVKGSVHASERVEIREHGIVLGEIFTPCLVVDPGGYFDGNCHMPAPEPAKSHAPAPGAPAGKQN